MNKHIVPETVADSFLDLISQGLSNYFDVFYRVWLEILLRENRREKYLLMDWKKIKAKIKILATFNKGKNIFMLPVHDDAAV